MISIAKEDWEVLLNRLEDLIYFRISETRDFPAEHKVQQASDSLERFDTGFISDSIGLALNKEEEFICFLSLLPFLVPGYFEAVISRIFPEGTELQELGGARGINHRGFIPTGETALFLLAGNDLNHRVKVMQLFHSEQPLNKNNILHLETTNDGEPYFSGKIILNQEILEKILFQKVSRPRLSTQFPAKYITTGLDWDNLVINEATLAEVEVIRNWIACHERMVSDWNMKSKFREGYKALFYGPPGTGKTFTVTLLGKQFGKDVFRIDLSQVVSKYIGETEKNLERIFNKAEQKDWILFFDEADALFGKRTSVANAHDRYANQETSYLLQRIEDYNGLVILASNNKTNIDAAFLRRFDAIIHFPLPDPSERSRLWNIYLPASHGLTEEDLQGIAAKYEVTGSTILNAIHNSAINAFASGRFITHEDLIESLRREFRKEDRMLT